MSDELELDRRLYMRFTVEDFFMKYNFNVSLSRLLKKVIERPPSRTQTIALLCIRLINTLNGCSGKSVSLKIAENGLITNLTSFAYEKLL